MLHESEYPMMPKKELEALLQLMFNPDCYDLLDEDCKTSDTSMILRRKDGILVQFNQLKITTPVAMLEVIVDGVMVDRLVVTEALMFLKSHWSRMTSARKDQLEIRRTSLWENYKTFLSKKPPAFLPVKSTATFWQSIKCGVLHGPHMASRRLSDGPSFAVRVHYCTKCGHWVSGPKEVTEELFVVKGEILTEKEVLGEDPSV